MFLLNRGMKIVRKFQILFYILIYTISFHKYFICDECHKITKKNKDDIDLNSTIAIYVHNHCACDCINNARQVLHDALFKDIAG